MVIRSRMHQHNSIMHSCRSKARVLVVGYSAHHACLVVIAPSTPPPIDLNRHTGSSVCDSNALHCTALPSVGSISLIVVVFLLGSTASGFSSAHDTMWDKNAYNTRPNNGLTSPHPLLPSTPSVPSRLFFAFLLLFECVEPVSSPFPTRFSDPSQSPIDPRA